MIECRAPKNSEEFEQYYHLRWQTLREPWQQAKGSEKDELESQAIHRLIIDDKQQVLAVGRLHFIEGNQAQIRYMAVAESCHGQGYGRIIINALEQAASKFGVRSIHLNAREGALGFYQRLGYEGNTVSHLLYGTIKHIAMEKPVILNSQQLIEEVNDLVDTWYSTIPLSKAMAINITSYDYHSLITTCDLAFNKNLHNTMFAGSIYTLATLTGWGWVHCKLIELGVVGDIVLADANIKYCSPIEGIAYAVTDNENKVLELLKFKNLRNEKINVNVNVYSGEKIAARFTATYVVKPKKKS
ncbi:bifunctional GNAT family N-acetyltransferase/hotdog fold thioesterase [Thalassotalea profundi]|uniref:GNAT family N-acetyltransferase n=1 Tax=Thalassotalea profundi TaxID=2036687 RepID=A0ABQ3IU19_9GAMM|nr:bifunctional GNAT family N-acetyltransferase/hotdog fold thioesterase [Thalassotalea profundi]GHE94100.1 GNAT family N-acetyltransferase [Thalassotalea profundi]